MHGEGQKAQKRIIQTTNLNCLVSNKVKSDVTIKVQLPLGKMASSLEIEQYVEISQFAESLN